MTQPVTLKELRASGWESRTVKEEVRDNVIKSITANETLLEGVFGYENTVLPQLENALLAGHDIVILGERGQAKTRMIRSLVNLLDEWMPYIAGSEIFDDPYHPISRFAKELVAAEGDNTPIAWANRSERFGEKLATPDTSIADLIGEVDPIKVAEGRYLSDELTLHYGLVPRTNRGIFAINELPDLAERIQVGLLNVLEERDVQIRGYKVRLPLDVMLLATANPEDYTNRGRIITPLKDRFGSQIRTHYPTDIYTEMEIAAAEATPLEANDAQGNALQVLVPDFMSEVVAQFSHVARASSRVNQRSGVSVRMTVANLETLIANATRRCLQRSEIEVVPRVSDLAALITSTAGKIEIDSLEEGRDEQILRHMLSEAVLAVFADSFQSEQETDALDEVVASFDEGLIAQAGDDVTTGEYVDLLKSSPALTKAATLLAGESPPAVMTSAVELILEGLHLSKRLNKDDKASKAGKATYRSRSGPSQTGPTGPSSGPSSTGPGPS